MNRHMQRIVDHLWGPTGSILLHILIIFALIRFVQFATRGNPSEVEVQIMEPEAVDLEELKKLDQQLDEIEPPEVDVDVNIETDTPAPDDVQFESTEPEVDFDALDIKSDVSSPLVMRGLYQGRSKAGRSGMLHKYGGRWAKVTEASVIKALEWLKNHQEADGSWKQNRIAMTGLALLTFLAHGETPASEKYGQTVEKAMRYLLAQQQPDGFFGKSMKGGHVYEHAIATYAIAEAYGLTRIPMLKDPVDRAAGVIVRGQQTAGGWNYGYEKGARRDTSVAGWQIQALKAAYLAGAETPGLKEALSKAVNDLNSVYNPEIGSFGYTAKGGRNDGMTGVGVLCLQLLGHAKDPEVRGGLQALRQNVTCNWDDPILAGLYGWYYITQAMFHHGGQTWKNWNNQFARTITSHQQSDGHWDFPLRKGNKQPEHGAQQGPVYSTCLSALMLQVYYRHLPTFKDTAVIQEDTPEQDDDVVIEVI